MEILYVENTFKHFNNVYKKGTYLLMANYRAPWYLRKYPVKSVMFFQMFWGARPCVLNLTRTEMIKWYRESKDSLKILLKFIKNST